MQHLAVRELLPLPLPLNARRMLHQGAEQMSNAAIGASPPPPPPTQNVTSSSGSTASVRAGEGRALVCGGEPCRTGHLTLHLNGPHSGLTRRGVPRHLHTLHRRPDLLPDGLPAQRLGALHAAVREACRRCQHARRRAAALGRCVRCQAACHKVHTAPAWPEVAGFMHLTLSATLPLFPAVLLCCR